MVTATELRSTLREVCYKNGGVSFGVASARDADALPPVKVGWTINTVSKRPSDILPGAMSTLVFGVTSTDDVHEVETHIEGDVYEYPGYLLLSRIRKALAECLERHGFKAVYPVEDVSFSSFKAMARLAGIGAFGKNSLIISPEHGPWLRLGVIFTDAVVEPHAPFDADLCRECTLCVDACPVGALRSHVVDDMKCLVGIPEEDRNRSDLRAILDIYQPQLTKRSRVMCTRCQVVCPYTSENRRSRAAVKGI